MSKPTRLNENSEVALPLRNIITMVIAASVATWAYFGIVEKLNQHGTTLQLMQSDLEKNTEFRIKWPRGALGSLPADSEQFMMIEDLYKQVEKINKHIDNMALNKVNIEFLRKQMDKAIDDIEKLKDANREIKYTNGNSN